VPTFSLMNLEGIVAHLLADEPGVQLVSIFSLMNLEGKWCPSLADEQSGIGAHLS
jgi:hypothetical protein